KILTALTALDYLNPDDVVTVGKEIYGLPSDYNTAIHAEGETITVRNLIRALMIRSGNETGCILALNTIRVKEERQNIPYADAERLFCVLMNEKARDLGALDTNFTNPYGLQSEDHYTTAYDMALISRAYMASQTLRQIAGERAYTGDSLEGRSIESAEVRQYNWESHNFMLLPGEFYYPYANGIKTGFTDEAGDCVTVSAKKGDIELIAVIFNSPEPGRWQDARLLLDYGFETYGFETIHTKDEILGSFTVSNPRLGAESEIDILADDGAVRFMRKGDSQRLERVITFDEAYLTGEDGALAPPIEAGATVGAVSYALDGATVYESTVRAASGALVRDFESDVDYYIEQVKTNIFTIKALPYWFGAAGFLVGLIGIIVAAVSRRKSRRDSWRGGGRSFSHYGRYK
ncbi:MAG: hypothetical protein LBR83_00585, partial [Clostridiales bacterium]|nr:hypothetical protein [Clostridiales bacterium]